MTAKTSRSFRLSQEAIDALQAIAERERRSQTDVIEGLILGSGGRAQAEPSDDRESDRQLIAELRQRIEEQADTIKVLSAALTTSQEATRAAQAIHAQTIASIAITTASGSPDAQPRRGLFARIRDAILGDPGE